MEKWKTYSSKRSTHETTGASRIKFSSIPARNSNWFNQTYPHGVLKGMFLFSSLETIGKSVLNFNHWQTYSFRHQLNFSGKHSTALQLLCGNYSLTFPLQFIAKYSFIQLSELGRQWRERKGAIFETVANGGLGPVHTWLRVRLSTAELPRTTCKCTYILKMMRYLTETDFWAMNHLQFLRDLPHRLPQQQCHQEEVELWDLGMSRQHPVERREAGQLTHVHVDLALQGLRTRTHVETYECE